VINTPRILRYALLAALVSGAASGHDLEAAIRFAAPAVVLEATYAGTTPVPFAKVQVFAPTSESPEFQTGLTDKLGRFSFVPDGPGKWRVIVDDEEGHRREVIVEVPDPFNATSPTAAATQVTRWERALTGVALIFGATGILYGLKARRSS